MASRAISGKPGGGKSYYAVKLLCDELQSTDRHIVTNLELVEEGIAAYLAKAGRSDIDVYSRITRIDLPKAEEARKVSEFWRYRSGGVILPAISDQDIKAGIRPDVASFGPGVHYFLDELHKFLNSRQWANTGPLLLWYISQHRHFGDDVTWITQHVPNVDKQWRSVTQDYTYCRNHSKEKFRGFVKDSNFHIETYLEPYTGTQTLQESATLKPDWAGIGSCYHTSIAHGAADKGQRAKGLPVWVLYAAVVVAALLLALGFMYGPGWVSRLMISKSADDAEKIRARMGLTSPASPSGVAAVGSGVRLPSPAGGAPLETPKLQDIFNLGVVLEGITSSEVVSSLGTSQIQGDVVVRPSPFGNAVVVSGTNWQNVVATVETVKLLDRSRAEMVMLQAVVLRTTKGRSSNVGVWHTLQDVVADGGFGLGNIAFDPVAGLVTFGSITAAQEVIRIMGSQNVGRYGFAVESRPVLAAVSGQEAWFTSGREVPVPVTTQNVANAQTSVQFKKVQFSFGVTPSVLPSGRIALKITQSNDDIVGSAEVGGNTVPTIATQSLTTRIELQEGQVAVLGGISLKNEGDDSNSFPILGAIPPLSWVLGNRDKRREESELLVVITAFRVPEGANPLPVRRAEPVKEKFVPHGTDRAGEESRKKQQKKGKEK